MAFHDPIPKQSYKIKVTFPKRRLKKMRLYLLCNLQMDKIQLMKEREDMQGSVQLNDLNILGLKDYYLGSDDNHSETKPKPNQENSESPRFDFEQNEYFNNTLDQLGFKLNEVIGHYLNELTSQPRLSLDSISLQNSENLDEEQQQQILDFELNALRQRIYKQIVDKINLSVIQSVKSFGSSCQLNSQSNIITTAFSKELITSTTPISQISQKSPPKSLSISFLDIQSQLHQSIHSIQTKTNKKIDDQPNTPTESDTSKDELYNKLKFSLTLNYQQQHFNHQLKEELSKLEKKNQISEHIEDANHNNILNENQRLKEENAKMIEFIQNTICDKCKIIPKNF
ncbi:unnamed protein product (macronuclear) [Paramecium tetraurelia]|uniref:Uncharacterized protein n=1 Tax=Paramecium tetraurelia TaxID=5888 RepID=A0DM35_PARTE|nr:uncharacterized protein GSPATT00018320001 [Paramecium tetraurelia]CAK84102.1 unnamed protein product [Paramecium tetraurelia]|eukprot:XP_001451499.1 hypothetical protein (macronuclear) [Paramecium tetraurelia strain d4-2]